MGGKQGSEHVTVSLEQLTLSNSLQLTAVVELLEERDILKQAEVLERMQEIRERKSAS